MANGGPEYLTVREVAALLRVKERKVYALAAAGEVPCSRATGKLLFPRTGIQAWIARHSSGAPVLDDGLDKPPVFVGSHDPLLDWALRESRSGIATFFDGSLDGLARLREGQAIGGGLHLYDRASGDWNRPQVVAHLAGAPVVLLEWAWRERGLIVAAGNPLGIEGLGDLKGRRLAPRQAEAGSQVLLETLLGEAGLGGGELDYAGPPARSEADLAAAIAEGKADAGFGLAAIARQVHLDFVPLVRERFDLVLLRRAYFEPPVQRFVKFCRTPAFMEKAGALGGYDVSGCGSVRYNGP